MRTFKKLGNFYIIELLNGKFNRAMEFPTEVERDEYFMEFCM